jgi:hypothetical protein
MAYRHPIWLVVARRNLLALKASQRLLIRAIIIFLKEVGILQTEMAVA